MCFPSTSEVDEAWGAVARALAAGELGQSVKVASRSPGGFVQVISCPPSPPLLI